MLRLVVCLAGMAALVGMGCARAPRAGGALSSSRTANGVAGKAGRPTTAEPKVTAQTIGVDPYPGATAAPGASIVEADTPDGPARTVSTRTRDSVARVMKHYLRAVRKPSVVEKRDGGMVVGRTKSGQGVTVTVIRSEPFTVITVTVRPQLGKEHP